MIAPWPLATAVSLLPASFAGRVLHALPGLLGQQPAPSTENQLLLRFESGWSPWWLLLMIPLAALLAWRLYNLDMRGLSRVNRYGLVGLRIAVVVLLILLAARPLLVLRQTRTYPGRVVVVVDDSPSMRITDDRLDPGEAGRLARRIGDASLTPLDDVVRAADRFVADVLAFVRDTDELSPEQDAYWARAETYEQQLSRWREQLDQTLDRVGGGEADPELAEATAALRVQAAATIETLTGLTRASTADATRRAAPSLDALDALAQVAFSLQAALDRDGDDAAPAGTTAIEGVDRLEAALRQLEQTLDGEAAESPGVARQIVEVVPLSDVQNRSPVAEAREALASAGSNAPIAQTDLLGALDRLSRESGQSPLTAAILLTDGRHTAGGSVEAVLQQLGQSETRVFTGWVGGDEPSDRAIVGLRTPPLGVAGQAIRGVLELKSTLDAEQRPTLRIDRGDETVRSWTPPAVPPLAWLGDTLAERLPLSVELDEPGRYRQTLLVEDAPGEVVAEENNRLDFIVDSRPEPVRTLLLDWKPRWQTRFVSDVLRRMPYVDLNAIIVVSQPDGRLERGSARGAWPGTADELSIYDLIIVGDLPPDLLSADEKQLLRDWVNAGGVLMALAPRQSARGAESPTEAEAGGDANADAGEEGEPDPDPAPPAGMPAPWWAGLTPETGQGPAPAAITTPIDRTGQLRLTADGLLHPLTLAMAESIALASDPAADTPSPAEAESPTAAGEDATADAAADAAADDAMLAATLLRRAESGQPVLGWRQFGRGKVLWLEQPLWRALNPVNHRSHVNMVVELVTWAVRGGELADPAAAETGAPTAAPDAEPAGSGVAWDGSVYEAGRPIQLYVRNARFASPTVTAIRLTGPAEAGDADDAGDDEPEPRTDADDVEIFEATATRSRAGVTRYVLPGLPPGRFVIEVAPSEGEPWRSPVVDVVRRDAELHYLAVDLTLPTALARGTGGEALPLSRLERLLARLEPRARVEQDETSWRIWAAWPTMLLIAVLLATEWVWRKMVGRI